MRKRKIGIEALGIDIEGGARTSIVNLIQYLKKNLQDVDIVLYLSREEPDLKAPNISQVILPFRKGVFTRIFLQFYLPIDVFFRRLDLIHFTKSQANLIIGPKKIITIHDLTILQHPEIHSKLSVFFWNFIQPIIAKKMDAIITVSNNAAKDIRKIYNVNNKKLHVIYNSSQFDDESIYDQKKEKQIIEQYHLPAEYFFYVGILALKKNLDTLIEAYKILNFEVDHLPHLLLVGPYYPQSDGSNVLDLVTKYNLGNKILYMGRLPKEHLFYIFKCAKLFVFPSYHEGFGIPCLEAMQLGVPVIASKASAIPEIVGAAGILIDNYLDPYTWADAIFNLNNSLEKREKLIAKGKKRYETLSKKHSLSALVNLYKKLLD